MTELKPSPVLLEDFGARHEWFVQISLRIWLQDVHTERECIICNYVIVNLAWNALYV